MRWFCSKKCKIGKENLYVTKNQLKRNQNCCVEDNHNYMSNMGEKEFSDSNLKKLLAKYQFFKKLPQISHIHNYHNFQV